MGQTMNLNQFSQSAIKGDSATKVNLNTLSVQIDPNSTNTLLPGDGVVLTTTTGSGTILVDKALATQQPLGFIFYNIKTDHFVAGDAVEIGLVGAILFVQAQGSIQRGNNLEYVPSSSLTTGPLMKVAAGINPVSALSLSNASDSDIFRIIVIGAAAVSGTFTGGTINNTPVGASTPSTGNFTSVSDAIIALTPSPTVSLNPALGGLFTLTPAQNCTINAASVNAHHQRIVIEVVTSGTTSYTITFGSNFRSSGTLTTGGTTAKKFLVAFEGDSVEYVEASRTAAL